VKEADYLLVSLYWWRDVFEFLWWLSQLGIDPRQKKPVIIIGGMAAQNPRPISDYFHYAVVGDGEACINQLLDALESGADPYGIDGVWHPLNSCAMAINPAIPTDLYVENRKAEITRIEIARGCKSGCPFCQLSFSKPYREMSLGDICKLLEQSPTRTISAFAPNRCAHSKIKEIDEKIAELGLHNMGSDTRLDQVKRFKRLDCVRFGIEGFSERTRRNFGKVTTNKRFVDGMIYIATKLENLRGNPMKSATMYMIGDLPGETREDMLEFWDVMKQIDMQLARKFTLFLSTSSFVPAPFTPMQRCGCNPYTDFNWHFEDTRPRFKNIVIATRGYVAPAPARLGQLLTVRGDERLNPVMLWIATRGQRFLRGCGKDAARCGKMIEKVLRSTGFDVQDLYRELPSEYNLPWANIMPPVVDRKSQ
jgi:radical SAM superfamily enzyme YgiQ (UPF0313 family)